MGPAKRAKRRERGSEVRSERLEVRGETATPRRVSPALLDDCDKGTWNLSIYCNSSGRPSKAHVTPRDPTLDAVGTRSCAIRRGMSKKRATAIFDLSLRVGPGVPEDESSISEFRFSGAVRLPTTRNWDKLHPENGNRHSLFSLFETSKVVTTSTEDGYDNWTWAGIHYAVRQMFPMKELKVGFLMLFFCTAIYIQIDPRIWSSVCQLLARLMVGGN